MPLLCKNSLLAAALLAGGVQGLFAADDYQPGPDSSPQQGVPAGEVTKYTFDHSKIFPGTVRDYWVYVPHQYDPARPACLYVGQDGVQFKAPTVFDNLIARHEMPVTIGVFVMHGRVKADSPEALDRFNRSYEYDGLGDNYARFLIEELLPEVEKKSTPDGRPIRISNSANDHAIGGSSSGAICAFTAAWERPDMFNRVFSSIGTYVDQRGGNDYPAMIRKHEPKPLRVFLQDGSNDLNKVGGSWFLANQEMLSALEFAGYEVNHIWGDGGHNGKQATAIFPDAMRWLWKDWPKQVAVGSNPDQPVARIVIPGEDWEPVQEKMDRLNHPDSCQAYNGNIYRADPARKRIWLVPAKGKKAVVDSGIAFTAVCLTPDQSLLLAAGPDEQFVYSFHLNPDGTLAWRQPYHHLHLKDGEMRSGARSLAVDNRGDLYVSSEIGIQVCDQAGRQVGVIGAAPGSTIAFGETDPHELYAISGGRVFKRKFNVEGALSTRPPFKPAPPNL